MIGAGRAREALVGAGVLVAAVAVRVPYLHEIPRYNDELTLWRLGGELARGGTVPLVFADTGYNGPLLIYLLAATRWLTDAIEPPRWIALAGGSLVVAMTYLLGRFLVGRVAGLVAALLLGLTVTSVVVYGHVLHMTGLAMVFLVAGWLCACLAVQRTSGAWLVAGGVLTGLAVQSHPLGAAFVPGLVAWLLARRDRRSLLLGRWGVAALGALLLPLLPLAAYHAPTVLGDHATRLTGVTDDLAAHWRAVPYTTGVANLVRSMVDAVSSARHGSAAPVGSDPLALALSGLALAGAVYAALRGAELPLLLAVSALVFMPLPIRDFDNTLLARYSGLALPALALGMGCAAELVLRGRAAGPERPVSRTRKFAVVGVVGLLAAGLAARLVATYEDAVAARRTNADIVTVLALAEASGLPVVLDGRIKRTTGRGSGPSAVLHGLFEWRGVEVKKESTPDELDDYLQAITWPVALVVSDATKRTLSVAGRLESTDDGYVPAVSDVDGWGVYILEPQ